ncbi:DNA N-6-adenine-methyltransferase [Methylobacterium sp. E-066]|uniref:DNA N-6-adenine-methyltransferase n=1 Tax=Methylobacterium sp. E-066 TaxID=2836584 RepID=UPI003919C1B8
MTQVQLAEAAGISVATVRNLERGRGTLSSWSTALGALGHELRGRSLVAGPIGAALVNLRERRGLSRRALARMLGVSRTTLSALEAGGPGRLETLETYAATIGAGLYLTPIGATAGFYTTVGNSSAHHGWETPPELVAALESVFGRFDLDPCAATADASRARVKARVRLTVHDNGLTLPWRGRIFVNPPYGKQLGTWVAKCAGEASGGAMVVGLVPARTDTRWWHLYIAGAADVFMLRGRLRFGDGAMPAPFPSAVVVWGASAKQAAQVGAALPVAWHVPAPIKAPPRGRAREA